MGEVSSGTLEKNIAQAVYAGSRTMMKDNKVVLQSGTALQGTRTWVRFVRAWP